MSFIVELVTEKCKECMSHVLVAQTFTKHDWIVYCIRVKGIQPMNSIQSSHYKASLRSKIAVRAAELFPGDSMDAIKERMTFTRKMYRMVLEEKNIDLFWLVPLH